MTLEAIKEAIAELPENDKTSLRCWLNAADSELWERQIEADFSEGGAGLPLLEEWDAEIKDGAATRLDEFLKRDPDESGA